MEKVRARPDQGKMFVKMRSPLFPDDVLHLCIPEAIGDGANAQWGFEKFKPRWAATGDAGWSCAVSSPGELEYQVTLTGEADYLDVGIALKNASSRAWNTSFAFTCVNLGGANSFFDLEMLRTFVRLRGRFERLIDVERKISQRPLIQLYSVANGVNADEVPFVRNFGATCPSPVEGLMVMRSREGSSLAAVASEVPLFLFNNAEYSCMHCCPNFGALKPGETGRARTRIYVLKDSLDGFYSRYRKDFSGERHGS